ncbi:VTT domain-containing protein [Patescibacteria group bacterium]|nr:VTT domain-containing protein [Patescibacteria group bacterium]
MTATYSQMKLLKKIQPTQALKALFVIVVLFLALHWLIPILTSDEFRSFVEKLGPFGPLVVITYTVLSHVLAPVAGTPGILLSITMFGIYRTMLYVYLGSMLSASINFFISRHFGRKWVTKLAGTRTMNEIDEFVEASGTPLLILSRVFGFSLFEVVSYAVGFTNMPFKKYFAITAVFSLIPNIAFTYIFRNIDITSGKSLIIWLVTLIGTGILFALFIKKYSRKSKRES